MNKEAQQGFPFAAILTLIFVVAKLAKVIAWSWWVVFAPMWIGVAVVLVLVALAMAGAVIVAFAKR